MGRKYALSTTTKRKSSQCWKEDKNTKRGEPRASRKRADTITRIVPNSYKKWKAVLAGEKEKHQDDV